jgi:hypothetical protein
MGYNARNDEIRDNVTRMRREVMSYSFIGGQHAYFENTKAGRVFRLADPCPCCVAQRLCRRPVHRRTSLNSFDTRVYRTGARLRPVTPGQVFCGLCPERSTRVNPANFVGPWSTSRTPPHWLYSLRLKSAVGCVMDGDTRGTVLGLVVIILACGAVFLGIELIGNIQQ